MQSTVSEMFHPLTKLDGWGFLTTARYSMFYFLFHFILLTSTPSYQHGTFSFSSGAGVIKILKLKTQTGLIIRDRLYQEGGILDSEN